MEALEHKVQGGSGGGGGDAAPPRVPSVAVRLDTHKQPFPSQPSSADALDAALGGGGAPKSQRQLEIERLRDSLNGRPMGQLRGGGGGESLSAPKHQQPAEEEKQVGEAVCVCLGASQGLCPCVGGPWRAPDAPAPSAFLVASCLVYRGVGGQLRARASETGGPSRECVFVDWTAFGCAGAAARRRPSRRLRCGICRRGARSGHGTSVQAPRRWQQQ
jgi:hypothetical protein